MNKYIVYIKEVHHLPVNVEAANENEARETVAAWLANEDDKIDFDNLEYSHTEDVDSWMVQKA